MANTNRRVVVTISDFEYRRLLREARDYRKHSDGQGYTWRDVLQNEVNNALFGLIEQQDRAAALSGDED